MKTVKIVKEGKVGADLPKPGVPFTSYKSDNVTLLNVAFLLSIWGQIDEQEQGWARERESGGKKQKG